MPKGGGSKTDRFDHCGEKRENTGANLDRMLCGRYTESVNKGVPT